MSELGSAPVPPTSPEHLRLCLTVGDPTGIGPELAVKLLQQPSHWLPGRLVVIGHLDQLEATARALDLPLPTTDPSVDWINTPGHVDREPGAVAYMALNKAVELIHAGQAHAMVTGPISKDNLRRSGIQWSGHTEILQHLAQVYYRERVQADMIFLYRRFRLLLLTRHVPLRSVHQVLNVPGVVRSVSSLVTFCQQTLRISHPRLCTLGVNPHAGELDGEEEHEILIPALQEVSRRFQIAMEAPVAADAAFRGLDVDRLRYDAFVAAYHDQGLIPFKLVAGLRAVNVTIGLPFLRTSVSHGMAMDLVGRNLADPISLIEALKSARHLVLGPPVDERSSPAPAGLIQTAARI